MKTRIFICLVWFACAAGLFAQQNGYVETYAIRRHAETAPHWFTQQQIKSMNPKKYPLLRKIFCRTKLFRAKKATARTASDIRP